MAFTRVVATGTGHESLAAAIEKYNDQFHVGDSGIIILEFPSSPFDIVAKLGAALVIDDKVRSMTDSVTQDGNKVVIAFTAKDDSGKAGAFPVAAIGLVVLGRILIAGLISIVGIAILAAMLWKIIQVIKNIPMPLLIAGVLGLGAFIMMLTSRGETGAAQVVIVEHNPRRWQAKPYVPYV